MSATFQRGDLVHHKRTGWIGNVFGAGPGRKQNRWLKPKWLYVDWLHRAPATSRETPADLERVS